MNSPYARLDELTEIRNDFHREQRRNPVGSDKRAQAAQHAAQVEEVRRDETARLIADGIDPDEIRAHLARPELASPFETGIDQPTGEAEAHFGTAAEHQADDPEPEIDL